MFCCYLLKSGAFLATMIVWLWDFVPREGHEVLWWVCLSVCLSICSHNSKTERLNSPVLCMLPVAVARFSSDGVVICYLLPVLWMASGASPAQKMWGGHAWRARRARAYNGVWGQSSQQGPGQSPWSWVNGQSPPEAKNLLAFGAQRKHQICCILRILQTSSTPGNCDTLTPSSQVKTHRICINPRNDLWQKWGRHVHPSPPRFNALDFSVMRA